MASDAVNQIKDRVSIIDVIAPYVELHQAGKNMKGKSPFTNEKTPSFFVSPDRNMYYCFSTSKGGDIFTFVQEMEGVDFKGALKILAEKAGVELVPEDPKKRDARDMQYAALEAATRFYQTQLPKKTDAVAYLKARTVTGVTAKAWRIGYAPDEWRAGKQAVESAGFTSDVQRQVGLVKGESGKDPYDVFRDRIMFPICDPSGRVIGFSGRVLSKDSEAPKYVNSPDTALFNKSEALFGYDKAKQGIRTMDFSLIVEGQFDVVLAHQAGYTNTVAVSGTAMTDYHVALLQRLSNRCVLALDADRAGIAAVKRAADVMLVRGIDVKVARIPDGEDPADIISKDPTAFKKYIGSATHVIEFLLAVLKEETADERTFKLRARDEVVPYLLRIQNHIDRDHFEQVIADALDTEKTAIHLEVERIIEERKRKVVPSEKPTEDVSTAKSLSEVTPTDRRQSLEVYMAVAYDIVAPNIKNAIKGALGAVTHKTIEEIKSSASASEQSALLFTLENNLGSLQPKQLLDELAGRLEQLRIASLQEALHEKKEMQKATMADGDTSTMEAIMGEINMLVKKKAERPITAEDLEKHA